MAVDTAGLRFAAIERALAINDERWRVREEQRKSQDDAISRAAERQDEIMEALLEIQVRLARSEGSGKGSAAVANWALTIASSLGTAFVAVLELAKFGK